MWPSPPGSSRSGWRSSRTPAGPRYIRGGSGYANFYVAITFIPDNLIPFFKTGPFSWNGFFPYWFPFAMYGIWILVMLGMTVKAINREGVSAEPESEAGEVTQDPARLASAAT